MLFIIIMPQMNNGASYLFNAELPGAVAERTPPKIKESAMMILAIYISFTLLEIMLFLLAGVSFFQAVNWLWRLWPQADFPYFHDSLISFDNTAVELIAFSIYADCQHEFFLIL